MNISDALFEQYVAALLTGDHRSCHQMVQRLLEGGISMEELYTGLFQRSLYRVGELWEENRISVAVEHLATAITERILAAVFPGLLIGDRPYRGKALVSCGVNEYHQIGARMVADMMETRGWDTWFLGANTPVADLLAMIQEKNPDLLCLSVSVSFNIDPFKTLLETVCSHFPQLDVFIGGQAFCRGGQDLTGAFAHVRYLPSLQGLIEAVSAESQNGNGRG